VRRDLVHVRRERNQAGAEKVVGEP
jgi:hypothetical protein